MHVCIGLALCKRQEERKVQLIVVYKTTFDRFLGMATISENHATDVHRFYNDNIEYDDVNNTDEYELVRRPESYTDILTATNNTDVHSSSSIGSAIFNLSNSIIGAGAIGLGGAIAATGGIISIIIIVLCAILIKISADLTIQWTVVVPPSSTTTTTEPEQDDHLHDRHSYEDMGRMAFGKFGKLIVMISKFAYAVGSLIAYMVVIRDNLAPALRDLLYHHHHHLYEDRIDWILSHDAWCTWIVSALVVLPLCLLRDVSALAAVSVISIIGKMAIVGIVSYFWWIGGNEDCTTSNNSDNNNNHHPKNRITNDGWSTEQDELFHRHWLQIHWLGLAENLGTFVFCFVCQHTAHLTFLSLKPSIRTWSRWKIVSTASLGIACILSLAVGLFVYMTFWERSQSDIFELYPPTPILNVAKLLLCGTMLLTFPLPFLTCRELIIVFFWPFADQQQNGESNRSADNDVTGTLQEPLLAACDEQSQGQNDASPMDSCEVEENGPDDDEENYVSMESHPAPELNRLESVVSNASLADLSGVLSSRAIELMNSVLLPGEERQLKHIYHVALTCKLWFVVTGLAIASPNLGDVLALVGCVSGTLIAFVLPGCFAWKLRGYSHTAAILLLAGGIVGIVGTIFSAKKFVHDSASKVGKS